MTTADICIIILLGLILLVQTSIWARGSSLINKIVYWLKKHL